ncbi:hypothetical protein SDC9_201784 [bioreactor metagenome]|uniref:Uncharacterized protein n=1 Tax=bioreactor metagenome TaxID=1076179 RepID=A0A645IRV4_9ZZZZ
MLDCFGRFSIGIIDHFRRIKPLALQFQNYAEKFFCHIIIGCGICSIQNNKINPCCSQQFHMFHNDPTVRRVIIAIKRLIPKIIGTKLIGVVIDIEQFIKPALFNNP